MASKRLHRAASSSLSASRSSLLKTRIVGFVAMPSSARIFSTATMCSSKSGLLTSMRCRSTSASLSSSRVARNAAKSSFGRLRMKPTVSVMTASVSRGNRSRELFGSSVAKSRSSARTSLCVSALSSVDFPALVYPTMEMTGSPAFSRPARRVLRPFWMLFRAPSSRWILSRTRLRLISSFGAADPAREARHGRVLLDEARQQVLQLGEFHLDLAVAAVGPLGEDV